MACHGICSFIQKFHGCSLSFWRIRLVISNTAIATFSFPRVAESPYATLVSARHAGRKLHFGTALTQPLAHFHATRRTCIVRPAPLRSRWSPQLAALAHCIRCRSFRFQASRTVPSAMKYCSQYRACAQPRRFYLSDMD